MIDRGNAEKVDNPKVLNGKKLRPGETGIWCDRRSIYGNHDYIIGRDGNRKEVCAKYKADIRKWSGAKRKQAREDLGGYNLLCHCKPLQCHCDDLIIVANGRDDSELENPL